MFKLFVQSYYKSSMGVPTPVAVHSLIVDFDTREDAEYACLAMIENGAANSTTVITRLYQPLI